ncbi:Arylesterase [Nitrospina gracilis 3/211]|uniref:Arylesterase n=1 Tax=Nitrospina gracilis (strain 3/211) TaxID=1266370 RepID=M1ZB40_NITG3|nr:MULTISPECIES: arylesterase [Nitrospina]MCF8723451.1 acyl-CoA thioesterase-1 [Nitrospina sp. Nb-3]CCQ90517.1 Arylesterase [Nitrospina gracilis 3/211]
MSDKPVILAFGDSLTFGYQVPPEKSYPSRLQRVLKAKGYPHRVINAGVSGDTTAGGASRIDWLLRHDPQIVIIELGANDGLRGLPVDEMQKNLSYIIEACQKHGAKVLLAGMKITPNLGREYTESFEQVFHDVAEKYDVPLIPFFLEGVAGVQELTQADGLHPLEKGYAKITITVWKYLEPLLDDDEDDDDKDDDDDDEE